MLVLQNLVLVYETLEVCLTYGWMEVCVTDGSYRNYVTSPNRCISMCSLRGVMVRVCE